jgi:hypothetical protein
MGQRATAYRRSVSYDRVGSRGIAPMQIDPFHATPLPFANAAGCAVVRALFHPILDGDLAAKILRDRLCRSCALGSQPSCSAIARAQILRASLHRWHRRCAARGHRLASRAAEPGSRVLA